MLTLPNVLTAEERFQIPRLLEHNLLSYFSDTRAGIESSIYTGEPVKPIFEDLMGLATPVLGIIPGLMYSDSFSFSEHLDSMDTSGINELTLSFKRTFDKTSKSRDFRYSS